MRIGVAFNDDTTTRQSGMTESTIRQ